MSTREQFEAAIMEVVRIGRVLAEEETLTTDEVMEEIRDKVSGAFEDDEEDTPTVEE